jgi:hypothetical protein
VSIHTVDPRGSLFEIEQIASSYLEMGASEGLSLWTISITTLKYIAMQFPDPGVA